MTSDQPDNEEKGLSCENLLPMTEWLANQSEELCKPCLLPPVISWYTSELEERGKGDLAREIEAAQQAENDNVTVVGETMDRVKGLVDEETRARLLDFDCAIQSLRLDPDELAALSAPSQPAGHS